MWAADFRHNYWSKNCTVNLQAADLDAAVNGTLQVPLDCHRENSLLFLLLMLGTLWVGVSLYNFNKTSVPGRHFSYPGAFYL